MYDYLIVGAGLFGSVFAYEASKRGKKCLVLDRRDHIGGNIYSERIEGITVHQYGAHIFHTFDKEIWDYLNQFARFNHFVNSPLAVYRDELYNLPFNMNTFQRLWNVKSPQQAKEIIRRQVADLNIEQPANLEEQALRLVGTDVYQKLIKGYTEKQWGKKCTELPAFIIKRIPIRFTYDNNYFNDPYQGIPVGGYTPIIEQLLRNADVRLNTDYFDYIKDHPDIAAKVVYTGPIDRFFDFCCGELEYRSLRFETEVADTDNYQGNAVINYTEREIPHTRIIEHKHFEFGDQPKTVLTKEYPCEWQRGAEPYYPVNDERNTAIYNQYLQLAQKQTNVIFGGRLAEYRYYDMDKTVASALEAIKKEDERHAAAMAASARTIVVWGAQKYFDGNIDQFEKRHKVDYVYPDGQAESAKIGSYKTIGSVDEIGKLENPFVFIARADSKETQKIAQVLKARGIPFDHFDFHCTNLIKTCYLKAMGKYEYVDSDGNCVEITDKTSDKIVIKMEQRGVTKDNTVQIGEVSVTRQLTITAMGRSGFCRIGNQTTVLDAYIAFNSFGQVAIGDDCMLSHSIDISQSDQHPVFDMHSKQRINRGKNITIGNHVWIGRGVSLLGGANIGDNCVIGARTVTSSTFPNNVIIAGSPAKILRKEILWARDSLKYADYDWYDSCQDQAALKYLHD